MVLISDCALLMETPGRKRAIASSFPISRSALCFEVSASGIQMCVRFSSRFVGQIRVGRILD